MIVVALVGLFIWSQKHLSNEWAISPGDSKPVGPLIKVSGHPHSAARSTILLTDVYLTQLSEWQWFLDQLNPPAHVDFVSGDHLLGPNVPAAQLYTQAYLDMYNSQNFAKVAAMRALHLRVTGYGAGATVYQVGTTSPAAQVLSVADRIVSARGHAVSSTCSLLDSMSGAVPGSRVTLLVERARTATDGSITGYSRPRRVVSLTAPVPRGQGRPGCPGTLPQTAVLGVVLIDAVQWRFPIHVSINTANIGGPSAGLAMALGVIDALSRTSIAGHLKIAATGQIDPNGNVLDVGGVAQKTIAVENAGATVFLVPSAELGVATNAASGGLKVIAVDTLSQALAAIQRLSGTVPVPITGPIASRSARA